MTHKNGKIDYRHNFRIYLDFMKKYRKWFSLLLAAIFMAEAAEIGNKFLFKILIDRGTDFVAGTLTKTDYIHLMAVIAAAFIGFALAKSAFKWAYHTLLNKIEVGVIADLKRKFFNHILRLSHGFHSTHRTGSLISRLTRGGGAIERLTDAIVYNFAPTLFQFFIVAGSMIYLDWAVFVVIIAILLIFIAYSLWLLKAQQKANLEANDAEDFEKANISDIFTNIDSIKYFGKEASIKHRFEKITEKTKLVFLKFWNYFRWMDAGQTLIVALGVLLAIIFPLMRFLDGKETIGTVVFIYTTYVSLSNSLYGFINGIRNSYKTMADFESLFNYGKIENEIKDKPDAKNLKIRQGMVDFKNVSFSYGKRKIFSNLSLKVPKNKRTALVGHSGCGKSTLVKLLYRFFDVNEGSILIDGKDIRDFRQESLRGEMSIVPQECVLFNDTISNNIAFSKPHAKKKEILAAIKFAHLDKAISIFPKKENTIVGERGIKLSGGEKQRVSIARAILANKKVLVLDEATSSLDSAIESEIQADFKNLMKGRTTIIIAHRLSTIMRADKIVVMKKGQIVQIGTHKQLIKRAGEYRKLWNLQRGGYIK